MEHRVAQLETQVDFLFRLLYQKERAAFYENPYKIGVFPLYDQWKEGELRKIPYYRAAGRPRIMRTDPFGQWE